MLEARRRLGERADAEAANPFGGGSGSGGTGAGAGAGAQKGREFVDVGTLRQILILRAHATPAAEIESRLRLRNGAVQRLGPPGVVIPLS